MSEADHTAVAARPICGPQAASFVDSVLLRARVSRAFFVSLGAYTAFAVVTHQAGLMHGDMLVRIGIFFVLVMGLDLLFGLAGMLSFAHIGFFSVGAYTVAVLNVSCGLDVWLAAAAGVALNLAMSYLLGWICLRLSGSYFILGTLAFGLAIHAILVVAYPLTGGDAGLGGIARPQLAGLELRSDLEFGALVWTIAVVLLWLALALMHSRAGRALKALRSDPVAAASLGIEEARLRTNVFVASALFASVSGALYAMYFGAVHPESFGLGILVDVLLMLFLGGYGSIWGGLVGATFIVLLPELNESLSAAKELFNGLLFATIILLFPRGLVGAFEQLAGRLRARAGREARHPCEPEGAVAAHDVVGEAGCPARDHGRLLVDAVSKNFGGVKAVDHVSFTVAPGTIKGLIGPNGAGKSTIINLISGALRPTQGSISLDGTCLTVLRPDQVARMGLMRTFQHERLFADLNVIENVMVGYERGIRGSLAELFESTVRMRLWAEHEREARQAARAWLDAFGLGEHAEAPVERLPTGLRKLVEVARACASEPKVLLLDETAAGLNATERLSFRDILSRLRRSGMTILLIEHDLELVMEMSDEICVLDFGQRIADGAPAQVRSSEQVIAAYLGADA
jgi:ABC-type branched-subunit amino acid transport system ATPase component/ABC-type branched-subunit amino acid transport system permease subunit